MDETYSEVTGIKPTTLSKDGSRVRLIFRTAETDLYLQFDREHLEGLIDQLIAISEAAVVNAAISKKSQPDMPSQTSIPATLRIDDAAIVCRERSVLIRWGLYDQSGQVNIYGNAFDALRLVFLPSTGKPQ
jgi:hypothetical protein